MARKQTELPGMQTPEGDKELDAAAVNLKQLSKKRKRAQDAEIEGRAILERLMKDRKLQIYRVTEHDLLVTMSISEKVKVEEEDETAPAPDVEGDDDEIEMADEKEQKAKKKKAPSSEAPAEA